MPNPGCPRAGAGGVSGGRVGQVPRGQAPHSALQCGCVGMGTRQDGHHGVREGAGSGSSPQLGQWLNPGHAGRMAATATEPTQMHCASNTPYRCSHMV